MVDLDVGMPHGHEVDLHLANDALGDERPKVAEGYMIFVFGHTIINLNAEVVDVRSRADRNVKLEQSMEDPMKGGADQVATCVTESMDKLVGVRTRGDKSVDTCKTVVAIT